jgi:hypothetical protein
MTQVSYRWANRAETDGLCSVLAQPIDSCLLARRIIVAGRHKTAPKVSRVSVAMTAGGSPLGRKSCYRDPRSRGVTFSRVYVGLRRKAA